MSLSEIIVPKYFYNSLHIIKLLNAYLNKYFHPIKKSMLNAELRDKTLYT